MNLAAKYRPKTFEDVTEQALVVDILKKMCDDEHMETRNFLLTGPAGTGKAQPLDSLVLTPKGFIQMKDVEVGTVVITRTGEHAKVSGVYPQGIKSVYRITLSDKTQIRVAKDHLNVVYRYNEDRKQREDYVLSTEDLIPLFNKSRFKLRVDTPEVEFCENNNLPIDPYLLGALIGDGALSNNFGFSNSEEDVVKNVTDILERDYNYTLNKLSGYNADWSISPIKYWKYKIVYKDTEYTSVMKLHDVLMSEGYPSFDSSTIVSISKGCNNQATKKFPELKDNLKLIDYNPDFRSKCPLYIQLSELNMLCKSTEKHIPTCYLLSSKSSRIRLLQGLFDTDGYTSTEGHIDFSTSSPQLSEDFAFLVRSLGIRDTVTVHESGYRRDDRTYVKCNNTYMHTLHMPKDFPYCTSAKHMSRYKNRQNPPIRNIVSIDYEGEEECQCIYVDHPDHTYISDGFIPTHNTTLARIMADKINDYKGTTIELDAASHSGVDSMRDILDQAHKYPIGSKWKCFIIDECHSLSSQAWQSALKTIEEMPAKSIFFWATTNPEKIPGTILSRVQQFQLSKISTSGIYDRLKYIVAEENKEGRSITYDEDAVLYIAKSANGGMRDAITLLDKALAYNEQITMQNVINALGLPNYDDYFKLLNGIAKNDNTTIVKIIHDVYNSGTNFVRWFEQFHSFICQIIKYIFLQDINATLIPSTYKDKIANYGTPHAVLCLRLANKLAKLNQELKTTQYLQEMAITELCIIPQAKK